MRTYRLNVCLGCRIWWHPPFDHHPTAATEPVCPGPYAAALVLERDGIGEIVPPLVSARWELTSLPRLSSCDPELRRVAWLNLLDIWAEGETVEAAMERLLHVSRRHLDAL